MKRNGAAALSLIVILVLSAHGGTSASAPPSPGATMTATVHQMAANDEKTPFVQLAPLTPTAVPTSAPMSTPQLGIFGNTYIDPGWRVSWPNDAHWTPTWIRDWPNHVAMNTLLILTNQDFELRLSSPGLFDGDTQKQGCTYSLGIEECADNNQYYIFNHKTGLLNPLACYDWLYDDLEAGRMMQVVKGSDGKALESLSRTSSWGVYSDGGHIIYAGAKFLGSFDRDSSSVLCYAATNTAATATTQSFSQKSDEFGSVFNTITFDRPPGTPIPLPEAMMSGRRHEEH